MNKKELVVKYRSLVSMACAAFNLFSVRIRKKGNNNRIVTGCTLMKKTIITIHGKNNLVQIPLQ